MSFVTVLMPVYNGEKYLVHAIKSILAQSFYDFTFIIINDGSTDESKKIIYSFNDKRIKYYENKINLGIAHTLNFGLALSDEKYIVRMDADDIALPQRIEKQVYFMEENSQIGISGTHYEGFGLFQKKYKHPLDHHKIKISLLTYNPIGHPTTIFRSSFFKKHNLLYNKEYKYCEDYELWTRAVNCFEMANIPEILLYHRKHIDQVSLKYSDEQKSNFLEIKKKLNLSNGF